MISRRGIFIIEYAVAMVVVMAAVIGSAVYVKRALSGRWKQNVDMIGGGRQYEPGLTSSVP